MFHGKKIVVVMPAYNAEKTLEQTVNGLDRSVVVVWVLTQTLGASGPGGVALASFSELPNADRATVGGHLRLAVWTALTH